MKQIKLTKELAKTLIEEHDPIITENYSFITENKEVLIRKFHYDKIADEYLKNTENVLQFLTEETRFFVTGKNDAVYNNLCKIVFEKNTLDKKQKLINEIKENIKNFSIGYLAYEDIDTVECYSNNYLDEDIPIYIIEP